MLDAVVCRAVAGVPKCTPRWVGGDFLIMNLHICVCVCVCMREGDVDLGPFWGEVSLLLLSGWFLLVLRLLVFALRSGSICMARRDIWPREQETGRVRTPSPASHGTSPRELHLPFLSTVLCLTHVLRSRFSFHRGYTGGLSGKGLWSALGLAVAPCISGESLFHHVKNT